MSEQGGAGAAEGEGNDEGADEATIEDGLSDEEQERFDAQQQCAQWYGNALRMLVPRLPELEVVLYLIVKQLGGLYHPGGVDLPPQVALVRDCANAVRLRLWPECPPIQKGRGRELALSSKFPLTLDAMFALGVVEASLKFTGANAEARAAIPVGQPGGPVDAAEAAQITETLLRVQWLVTGMTEAITQTRNASGIPAMGMAPAADLAASVPASALAPAGFAGAETPAPAPAGP